jgi:hypothetical protein
MWFVFAAVGCSVDAPTYVGLDGPGGDADGVDARIDGSMTPDASPGAWSTPVALGLNTSMSETMAKASPNGLELYFASPPAGDTIADIYYVTRGSVTDEWGTTRTGVGAINSAQTETEPCVSADGLEMHFRRGPTIYATKRTTIGSAWQAPTSTTLAGDRIDILADGLTMYFRLVSAGCPVDTCRTKVTRATTTSAWGSPVTESIHDGGGYQMVDFSADGLRVLLSGPMTAGPAPFAIATRATLSDPWGPAVPISDLALFTNYRWAHWSWDEREMYIGADSGDGDIYVSTLAP